VAFYVPLGPRGLLFRIGTFVIGICGGVVYRLACSQREIIVTSVRSFPSVNLKPQIYTSVAVTDILAGTSVASVIANKSEIPIMD
jgi:hypothetical protein